MSISPLAATFLLLTSVAAEQAAAQRRAPGQPATESTEVMVVARVGSKSYTSRVPGTCKYEPSASIYDVPAALWMVEGAGSSGSEIKQLSLTLWRPKDGSADQISLSLQAGSSAAHIDVNPRSKPVGTGSVELQPQGSGGKFELKGKDAAGTPVNLTISCPSFAAVEAAGG
jgi:hypothetical protein